MISKTTMVTAGGALLGVIASPYILNMLNIAQSAGPGLDDVATALIIVIFIMIVNAIL